MSASPAIPGFLLREFEHCHNKIIVDGGVKKSGSVQKSLFAKGLRVRVIVPTALFVFGSVIAIATILILSAVSDMASHANLLDEKRAKQTAAGALITLSEQLSSTISDYTAWDDAASAVYDHYDQDWLVQNFGVFSGASTLFDTFFLIDPKGRQLMAYERGEVISQDYMTFMASSFHLLFNRVKNGLANGHYQDVAFVRMIDGVAIVAISALRSSEDTLTVDPKDVHFVVLARHLEKEVIASLEKNYILPGLELTERPPIGLPAVDIRNLAGKAIGALSWHATKPGTDSYFQVRPHIIIALAILGAFFLGLLFFGHFLIVKLKRDEQAAVVLARQDVLTGLWNRHGFYEMLAELQREANGSAQSLVLIYFDLDRFKAVNDTYGHLTGDKLIRAVAAGVRCLLPDDAVFARIGGDEFAAAFLSEKPQAACKILRNRIHAFFDEPLIIGDHIADVGTSMGVAISHQGDTNGEEMLRRADVAMYQAKKLRDGKLMFYDPALENPAGGLKEDGRKPDSSPKLLQTG